MVRSGLFSYDPGCDLTIYPEVAVFCQPDCLGVVVPRSPGECHNQ
jgi:hypothetical protein